MDEKSNNVEIGTVEIENSCAKLSLTGAFDYPEQSISYADLNKQERGLINLSLWFGNLSKHWQSGHIFQENMSRTLILRGIRVPLIHVFTLKRIIFHHQRYLS